MGIVRRAEAKDADAVMGLLVQVNRVHAEGRPDLFKLATKYTKDELLAIMADDQTPVFVFEDEDGRVCGHAFTIRQEIPEDHQLLQPVKTLYIDDICVDEAARGKHVGSALYEHVIAFARENGFYNVTLNVWALNPAAQKFYEAMGMQVQKTGMETIL